MDSLTVSRKILMLKAGITNKDLEERWEVTSSTVSQIVHGKLRSAAKEQDFAELVGAKHDEIFETTRTKRDRESVEIDV